MRALYRRYRAALWQSVGLHLALLVLLLVGNDWLLRPQPTESGSRVVDATLVGDEVTAARIAEWQAEARPSESEPVLEPVPVPQEEAVEQAIDEAAEQMRREAERQAAEQARREAQEAARREAEAARLAAEREAAERARRQAEEEARRQAEAQRREAERQAAEQARREAEEVARRQAELDRQARDEAALRQALAAEEVPVEESRAPRGGSGTTSDISPYVAAIQGHVRRVWIRPPGNAGDLSCLVAVRLAPGGEVVGVDLVQSSGDAAYDRSVVAAIYKASPLPVPSGADFEPFRRFRFLFTPR